MKTNKFILVLLILCAFTARAQSSDLQIADRYYERTFYSKAIPLYEKAVKKQPQASSIRKLADSYYFINDYEQALKWYQRVAKLSAADDELFAFRLVHTLKAAGQYNEANDLLRKRASAEQLTVLNREIDQLEDISAIGQRFEISSLPVNTPDSEFGAWQYGDTLLYSAVRNTGKTYKWNGENYLDLYAVPLSSLNAGDSASVSFSKEINSKLHEGTAVLTRDGKTLYFTRNYSNDGKRMRNSEKVSPMQLFRAEWNEGKWTNIASLPFNSSEYSTEHPALSPDEKTLYFASDMPGSIGSFDIYSVTLTGGSFGEPKNLGPLVNTSGKEQFPFISSDNKLYFSSDGHLGYGAMDVFVSDVNEGQFSQPLNVGLPVNSGYDDFSFTVDAVSKLGYFASNRKEGRGSDDLYSFREIKPLIIEPCKQSIEGIITDVDTALPLEAALVILTDGHGVELSRVITAIDGQFRFHANCERSYMVIATKVAYSKGEKSLKLLKERDKVHDASLALKSDTIALKQQKELGEKTEAEERKKRVDDILSKEKDVVKDKERLIIKTEPIYFDYDLWYIRKESKPILDRVIWLMKQYPRMVVEIGSHTDVRGNNEYNRILSAKRAASTREYFIGKGVPESRIFSKGYGESVPVIRCVPDASCSEEQHELNRRSEFVITDL